MFSPRVFLGLAFILSPAFPLVAASTYSPNIAWVDCAKHVPIPATNLNVTGVNLSALPPTLHCGQLVVPVDYSKPISASNQITLGLAMYRPPNPKGVLFL